MPALAFVARDKLRLLVQASSKLISAPSIYAAKVFAIDWTFLEAVGMNW